MRGDPGNFDFFGPWKCYISVHFYKLRNKIISPRPTLCTQLKILTAHEMFFQPGWGLVTSGYPPECRLFECTAYSKLTIHARLGFSGPSL